MLATGCVLLVGAAQFCERVLHAKLYQNLGHVQEDSGANFFLFYCLFYYGCYSMHLVYRRVFVSKSKLICWYEYYLLFIQYWFEYF